VADGSRFVYTPRVLVPAAAILSLPLIGLLLLIWRPALDLHWEHHPTHFWLVLTTALLSAVLAYATGAAAMRRGDARVLLVSLAFLSTAGFLGLHALATPQVLLDKPNAGFVVATPVGLVIGSVFAALSGLDLSGERNVRAVYWGGWARLGLLLLMAVWAVVSLLQLPPLQATAVVPERAGRVLTALAVPAILLYAVSAGRYVQLWRRRPSLMLLAVMSAFVLLAEAMLAITIANNWHLSWWEWHVLLLAAFALVAVGAQLQWREERFADLYLDETVSGTRDVSVLFADLQGFTTFSEAHPPEEVSAMLNTYFQVAVPPVVHEAGGEIDRIIGDALMVVFNKRGDQPDHAMRAAHAGLALQEATARVAAEHPNWPRFRVGINTGAASVGLLGTQGGRTHTVIGDVVNVASRIEGRAPVGGVAIGPTTRDQLPGAVTVSLGYMELKGREDPVEVFRLVAVSAVHP
jgi:class 3 adenylate cyclase